MDITDLIDQNQRELEALKATQRSSLSSYNKNIFNTNYTVQALGTSGTYYRIIYVFFGNNQGYTPIGNLGVRITADNRSGGTSGRNQMMWVRQFKNQSAGQIGWEIMIGWILTDGTIDLNLQVISNLSGTIDVIDGGRRTTWL